MILCRIFVMSGVEKKVEFPHVKLQKSLRFERITGLIFLKKMRRRRAILLLKCKVAYANAALNRASTPQRAFPANLTFQTRPIIKYL